MQQEDIEFDKQLDNLIDESIKKGYDDEKIIDTVLSGGKNTLNPKMLGVMKRWSFKN